MKSSSEQTPETPHLENDLESGVENRNRIPGDVVNKATADLADNQRSAIRRLHAHYASNDLSLGETGELIGRSGSTIGLIFRGKYEAKLDDVVNAITRFFDLEDRRSHARKLQFIPTKLTERIWQICDSALELQRVAFLFGESQIGKTEALQAYAESHNHGSTIYVSVPTGGFLTHFLARLADSLRISHRMKQGELRQRIIQAFDARMLLIVDEAHQCISQSNSTSRLQTIEFIREIFDQRHCGLVICATKVFKEAMERGAVEKLLRQVKRRRLCAAELPDRPTQEDLNTFAAAHGLPPSTGKAREIEAEIVNDEALGMWLSILRNAAKLAALKKQKLDWPHVLTARLALRHLEGN
jgi:DNA transposition AAA+ family ATPase